MRAGFVGAADELLLLLGYRRYRFDDGLALDARGVVSGADEDEVVVHNLAAVYAVALGLELVFLRRGVRQDDVDVALRPNSRALPVPTATHCTSMPVSLRQIGAR